MVHDSLERDGLWDHRANQSMGALSDQANDGEDCVGRSGQNAFSVASHHRAAAAWENGVFTEEVVPVRVPPRTGGNVVVSADEGIRADASIEALTDLRPSFRP